MFHVSQRRPRPSTNTPIVHSILSKKKKQYYNTGVFHLNDNGWKSKKEEIKTTGVAPGARNGHTSTLVDGRWLYVFGGLHASSETCFNDVYCLDVKKFHWYVFFFFWTSKKYLGRKYRYIRWSYILDVCKSTDKILEKTCDRLKICANVSFDVSS